VTILAGILDEYLVKLGAVVDQSGMARFQQALREASAMVDTTMAGMAGAALKATVKIVEGFAAIGSAALGLADKVALADQEYRLFALHLYMSKDAARSLKVAMDALGQPLENLMWDPELRERTRQLIADQRAMAPGEDFDAQMKKIRDIRFEFTRLEVEVKYLGMTVVRDFMQALGVGPDWLLSKLRWFNNWVIKTLPELSRRFVTWFMPIWTDVKLVMTSVWQVIREVATAFTNLMGAVFLDPALESGTFNIQKFGVALQYVAAVAATVATSIALIVDVIARMVSVITELVTLQWDKIPDELAGLFTDVGTDWSIFKTLTLQMAQSRASILGSDAGTIVSSGASSDMDSALGTLVPGLGMASSLYKHLTSNSGQATPALINAMIKQESGGNQGAVSSKGAIGLMQLMPGTAKSLGVNPYDAAQNVAGGTVYINQLLSHYGGNVPEALGAYNAGPGRMNKFLAGKATLPDETKAYIARVMGRAGATSGIQVGSVIINITHPGADDRTIHKTVLSAMRDVQDKQSQRNLAEWSQLSYGF
jgi:hypothetical protein